MTDPPDDFKFGLAVDGKLSEFKRPADPPGSVDAARLRLLAGSALIVDSVESEGGPIISKEQERAILSFTLDYVPITDHGRLTGVVDRRGLAEKIGRRGV